MVEKGEHQYLVELYNLTHYKTIKSHLNFIRLMWQADPTFQTFGKFMVTSTYSHFTTARGELIMDFKKSL